MNSHVCQMFQYCSECKIKVCHVCHDEHKCSCGSWSAKKNCTKCFTPTCQYCAIKTADSELCRSCFLASACRICGKQQCSCNIDYCDCGKKATKLCVCGVGLCAGCSKCIKYCINCKKCDICLKSPGQCVENCVFCDKLLCIYCQNKTIDHYIYCKKCKSGICYHCGYYTCQCLYDFCYICYDKTTLKCICGRKYICYDCIQKTTICNNCPIMRYCPALGFTTHRCSQCYSIFTDRRPVVQKKLLKILLSLRGKLPRNLILLICEYDI